MRSPHAHAKIRSINVEAAKAAPGVLAAYTGHDVKADGLGMPKANMPRKRPDGKPMFAPQRPPLVTDRVRYVGDPVVMVDRRDAGPGQGRRRAGRDRLRAAARRSRSTEDTVKPGAPVVWDDCPDNISNNVERGKKADTEEAIKTAVSSYKVNTLQGVGQHVWAGYNSGKISVYDINQSPWAVKKDLGGPRQPSHQAHR